MPLSFPANPTLNQTYIYSGITWTFNGNGWTKSGAGAGGASITVSGSAPANPNNGALWFNSESGETGVYFGNGWVAVGGAGGSSGGGGVAAVYDIASSSTGYFSLPRGSTAQRPGTSANGYVRFNTTTGTTEHYTINGWESIGGVISVATVSPSSFTGNAGTVFTITGSGFASGCIVSFISNGGGEYAATTTFNATTSLTAVSPRNFTVAEEPLSVKVTNPSGATGTRLNAIDCGGTPTFTTAAGSLGNIYDSNRTNFTLATAAATDPDGSVITYAVVSGTLPPGLSFNTANAAITGTSPAVASDTTYTFTISASDGINTSSRQFSITVKAPIIETFTTAGTFSWTAPAGITNLSRVILIGAGGGGNSGNGQWAAGGGGGGYANALNVPVASGTTYSFVVGAKGLGATACGSNGNVGGQTSAFLNIAYGGGAGLVNTVAGAGGSFLITTGTNSSSAAGAAGNAATGDGSGGGGQNGGGNTYGTGTAGVSNFTAGNHAAGYGNGGGGGHSCQNGHRGGGDGSGGYIEIRY